MAAPRGHLMETKIQPFPIVILSVLSHSHRWHSLGTSIHLGRGRKKEAIGVTFWERDMPSPPSTYSEV